MNKSPFLHEWLFARAETRPEAPAVATPETRLSYGELADRVRGFAAQLAATGFGAGERMLVALPNTPASVVASLAVQSLGGTPVEVSRDLGAENFASIATQASARQAIIWARDAHVWRKVAARSQMRNLWIVHPGPLPGQILEVLREIPHAALFEDGRVDPALESVPAYRGERTLDPGAPAVILYTSGSTGAPRGVIQTYRNIEANTRAIVQYLGLSGEDRALLILPLYYCYGRSVLQTHLFAGGSVYLDNRFAFPRTVLEALGAERCTGFAGVPLTFEIIRRKVELSTLSFPSLRYLTQAGGAMAAETIDWAREAFRPARFYVMYGQTEATSRLSYLPPERAEDKRGSIGIPVPDVELAVVDDQGRAVEDGEIGNLIARGGNVTPGYLEEPAETASILRNGWLWTGDLAHRDSDGYFYHRGRSKEILKIGGHRVSPAEVEQILNAHPDVADAAVVALRDPVKGDIPAAFVVLRQSGSASEASIKTFCRQRMPAYRVPVVINFVSALPRNPAGKLLRGALTAAAESGASDEPTRVARYEA